MKIRRYFSNNFIYGSDNSRFIDFELTEQEKREAYLEIQRNYRINDIKDRLCEFEFATTQDEIESLKIAKQTDFKTFILDNKSFITDVLNTFDKCDVNNGYFNNLDYAISKNVSIHFNIDIMI